MTTPPRATITLGRRVQPVRCKLGLTFALLVVFAAQATAQTRVVAIGDVHGAYDQLVGILRETRLIDSRSEWSGGSTILVQIGDVPSRGPHTRQCLDLLMALEQQAAKRGGRVLPLLGNHEVMVMMGDLRYVAPSDFQSFASARSAELRDQAYGDYEGFVNERVRRSSTREPAMSREKWMAEHPLGYFEYRDAFGPNGQYGRWLRQHDAIAQVGDVLFLHGGLSPHLKFRDLQALNERIRSELARFDAIWQSLSEKRIIWRYMNLSEAFREIQAEMADASPDRVGGRATMQAMRDLLKVPDWLVFSPDGPLWYRGYSSEPEEKLAKDLERTLARLHARRIVTGHTTTVSRRITSRFNNRVLLIDTGMMADGSGGRASALEILNGRFTAYYSGGEQQVLLAPAGEVPAPVHNGSQDGRKP
jgi:hypothetical protein